MKSYNEVKKLTKTELLSEYQKLLEEYEELEQEKDDLNEWAGEQENQAYKLSKKLEEMSKTKNKSNDTVINDISKFIRHLEMANLYNGELEEFIQRYLRYDNKEN